jgi:NAD(P)-dependent dehydrogenase (short-subunit alcohol dehydrogenase family)
LRLFVENPSRAWYQGRLMNAQPLKGRVVMVTGAGRRIGRVIALAFARAGADVAINYHASRADALNTVKEIHALGRRAEAFAADVATAAQVRRMFREFERRFERLDVLVNNAGVFFPVPWDRLNESDWDRVLGTNLKGAFFCAQAAAKLMLANRGGHIINISSLGGLQAWPSYIHYCSSKAANIMMTRCLAKALAPRIRVNSIAPGTILFPGEKHTPALRRSVRSTPLRIAGRPEDIAEMALHLATRGQYITGQVFVVDGGQSIP